MAFVGEPKSILQERSTIAHWQLRDVLHAPSENECLIPYRDVVKHCNLSTKIVTMTLMDFSPAAITTGYGYLACGGEDGSLTVKHASRGPCAVQLPNRRMINGLTLSKHRGEVRLLVSRNNGTITALSLPQCRVKTVLQLPARVNQCSVSPDGKRMIAVGDSNLIFCYEVSMGGYRHYNTMNVYADASFTVDWNASSTSFAVGSEDGSVSIWDIRHSNPLARIYGSEHSQSVRALKFTKEGGLDLLAFSEHGGCVHIVDTRDYAKKQSVRITGPENAISGMTFTPSNRKLLVSTLSEVFEMEVNDKPRRTHCIGSLL